MKFTIEKKAFQKALITANAVVERSNTIPVLAHLLLDARDGALHMTATDLDVQIKVAVNAMVTAPGRVTVPASMLMDIVRKMQDGSQVECEMIDTQFQIKSGRSRMKLVTIPAEDFPDFDSGKPTTDFALDSVDLCRLIRKAMMAVSTDESRYYLNGVYLHRRGDTLAAVGTDGHRLSLAWMASPEGSEGLVAVIVPRKTSQLVVKQSDGHDGGVRVRASDSKISFEWGTTILTSKLIDGTFPDYDRVIPKSNPNVAKVDPKALMAAVDRVSTVASEKGRVCKFTMSAGEIKVEMAGTDGGNAEDQVDCEYAGAAIEIGFNARYTLEALSGFSGTVIWALGEANSPSVITAESGDSDCMSVLMPMRF